MGTSVSCVKCVFPALTLCRTHGYPQMPGKCRVNAGAIASFSCYTGYGFLYRSMNNTPAAQGSQISSRSTYANLALSLSALCPHVFLIGCRQVRRLTLDLSKADSLSPVGQAREVKQLNE